MSNLKKKNIIVTGASGGIGNAIIKKLSEAGANILAQLGPARACKRGMFRISGLPGPAHKFCFAFGACQG